MNPRLIGYALAGQDACAAIVYAIAQDWRRAAYWAAGAVMLAVVTA